MADDFHPMIKQLSSQVLKNVEFNLKNVTFKDNAYIKYLYQENKETPEMKLIDLTKEIVRIFTKVANKSSKVAVYDAVIKSSEMEDELIVDTLFKYNSYHLSPIFHQFVHKPNSLNLKGNFCLANLRFPGYTLVDNPPHIDSRIDYITLIEEDEIGFGIDYKHDAGKKGFFVQNSLFLYNNFEFLNKFKYSVSQQDIKRNKDQRTFKAVLSKSFYERPFIFRENLIFDPISKLNFQYAHKIIENNFDDAESSVQMRTEVPKQDSLHQFKVSYSNCRFYNYKNFLQNQKTYVANNNANNSASIFYKISSSLNQTVNNSFLENKFFFRKFFNFDNLFIYQTNVEAGHILNTNSEKMLKISENFFIKNFKGVMNPGEKVIVEEGKTGDCLGNTYYLAFKNKILYNNIPILSDYTLTKDNFEISPFVFFNVLYCGNSNISYNKDYDRLHYSTGFGLNVLTDAFNIEVYYNLFVKKNKYDISPEFGINIGLD